MAAVLGDSRRAASITRAAREMLAQRLYGLCCGWQDVSDHNVLRRDLALQTAVGRVDELACGLTLSRLETSTSLILFGSSDGTPFEARGVELRRIRLKPVDDLMDAIFLLQAPAESANTSE